MWLQCGVKLFFLVQGSACARGANEVAVINGVISLLYLHGLFNHSPRRFVVNCRKLILLPSVVSCHHFKVIET
jgi:hypothetical protein